MIVFSEDAESLRHDTGFPRWSHNCRSRAFTQIIAGVLQPNRVLLVINLFMLLQEHAERPHVVQRLIAEAHMLVQSAQRLEVRLDKDIAKLQVALSCCLPAHQHLLLALVNMLACCKHQLAEIMVRSKGPRCYVWLFCTGRGDTVAAS